jgi:hypothetical protein
VSENVMKWGLFCLMAATVPVLYYMFVVGGYLPLIAIVALSFRGVWGFVLFNAVHLLIYGALFYWVAKAVARRLALLPHMWSLLGFASLSIALVAISFLPLYGIGHHESQSVDLYRLLTGLLGNGF